MKEEHILSLNEQGTMDDVRLEQCPSARNVGVIFSCLILSLLNEERNLP